MAVATPTASAAPASAVAGPAPRREETAAKVPAQDAAVAPLATIETLPPGNGKRAAIASPPVEEDPLEGMSGLERVAALLIALGPEASTAVLRHLREEDIERVTLEIFRMRHVPARVTDAILEDLYDALLAADYLSQGGLEFAQELLTRTLGPQRAAELIARLSRQIKAGPFDFLRDTDPMQLVSFIQSEHPQTIALILSYLQPEQAAMVLTGLHPDVQSDVAMRIALMDRTAPEVVKEVERLLKKKVSAVATQGYQAVGGVKQLVSVLNSTDNTSQKAIMDALDETHPELADEIKKNMFTFDDIIHISDRDMPTIIRNVDPKDLPIALRGASEELRNKFFKGMSSRSGQQLREEIEIIGPQRLATIEDAQQRIVAVIRRLEQAEDIQIARGGKDEYR